MEVNTVKKDQTDQKQLNFQFYDNYSQLKLRKEFTDQKRFRRKVEKKQRGSPFYYEFLRKFMKFF